MNILIIDFSYAKQGSGASITDAVEAGIFDSYRTKEWALKYAVNSACTILKVDQIIMAKRAGGPKLPPQGGHNSDDE